MQSFPLPYLGPTQKHQALSELMREPWSILLDSGGKDLNYNRFDVFASQPTVKLSLSDGQIELVTNTQQENTKRFLGADNPLKLMREYLADYKRQSCWRESDYQQVKLPFYGGWLGYASYDFGRYLEKLPELTDDDIQLPELQFGLYQWALITDHQEKTSHLYNFGLEKTQWHSLCKKYLENIESHISRLTNHPDDFQSTNSFKLTTQFFSNTSRKEYQKAFNRIQDYIHAGDCYQVNYAQRFQAEFQGDIQLAYQKLSEHNQAPFSGFLNFGEFQILSLSPERFIESHQNKVITQPIKGTRPRSQDPIKDEQLGIELKNSAKDCAENLMIVDLLRNDLSRTASRASVKVSELFGHYRFESVHHLISTVESELAAGYDNFDLLATTLPGGSITGAPKIRAMEIIEELETVRRNVYCGIIGYLDFTGNMDTNICIRTLIAKNQTLYCWAGGGLVADSEVNTEYQETFDKLAKILPVLSAMAPETNVDSIQ